VVVAANDVGDAHVVVIDHHGVHVGRRAIRTQDDEIVEVFGLEHDLALHVIVDNDIAAERGLDADDRGNAFGRFGLVAIAPVAVIARGFAGSAGFFAHLVELGGRAVAVIGVAHFHQLAGDFSMAIGAAELADRLAIPIEAQPLEAIDQRNNGGFGGAFAVGVLDTEQHLAALVLGIGPTEQRRAGASNVEIASRGRGETGDDLGHGTGMLGEFGSRV
jgi:hypothetical protein